MERRGREVAGPRAGKRRAAERDRRRHHGGRHHSGSAARPAGSRRSARSSIGRRCRRLATAGGGRYFELDRESDRDIANTIIDQTRRQAGTRGLQEGARDLYWNFLFAAAGFLGLGVLFLRDRVALALQLSAATAVFIFITTVF